MTGELPVTTSYWLASRRGAPRRVVDADGRFDVVVVGGGLTGLTAAYLLKKKGLRVALVERDRCAGGDSGHTSAHLTYVTDKPLSALVRDLGRDRAQAFWEAGLAGLRVIGDIVNEEGIPCGLCWLPGYLHLPFVDEVRTEDTARLTADAKVASDLGFDATYIERAPLVDRPAIRFALQARFEPLCYAEALIRLIDGNGSAVFETSPVTKIVDDPLGVIVHGHRLRCGDVVIATHLPTVGGEAALVRDAWAESALALFTSYVIAAEIPQGSMPDLLFWDTADPYRYVRLQHGAETDVVIFGGHDHRTDRGEDAEARYRQLEGDLARLLPRARTTHRWSGEVIVSSDGLPLIGRVAPHRFVATAFNGNGIPLGTVAALMAVDELTGRRSPWSELFAADREALDQPAGDSLQGAW